MRGATLVLLVLGVVGRAEGWSHVFGEGWKESSRLAVGGARGLLATCERQEPRSVPPSRRAQTIFCCDLPKNERLKYENGAGAKCDEGAALPGHDHLCHTVHLKGACAADNFEVDAAPSSSDNSSATAATETVFAEPVLELPLPGGDAETPVAPVEVDKTDPALPTNPSAAAPEAPVAAEPAVAADSAAAADTSLSPENADLKAQKALAAKFETLYVQEHEKVRIPRATR